MTRLELEREIDRAISDLALAASSWRMCHDFSVGVNIESARKRLYDLRRRLLVEGIA